MLVLHGSWIPGRTRFCLWAETPQEKARRRGRKPAVPPHPFAAPVEALATARQALFPDLNELDPPETIEAWLPAAGDRPQASPELLRLTPDLAAEAQPGELARFALPAQGLTPLAALDALLGLPRPAEAAETGITLGADLLFWSAAAKLAVALLAGQRYLPGMLPLESATRYRAVWQPVLDEPPEAGQVAALVASMPPICRALAQSGPRGGPESTPGPRAVLTSFLETIVDRAVRAWLPAASPKTATAARALPVGQAWLAALHADDPIFSGSQVALAQLHQAWRAWLEQLHVAVGQGFRISFRLEPPEAPVAPTQRAWGLRYFLQATDDLSLLIPAEEAWKARGSALQYLNRRFEQPQERLLAGLGLAARLFPPVEASLRLKQPEVARLTTDEAYGFLREIAPLLESSGFGVLVPPWWHKRGAASFSSRLKLKPKSAPKSAAPGKLTFDTLVDFDWQLALAGQAITPEEFRRLADLKTPLVQIRGEWVVLDPDAVDKAIKFWEDRRNRGEVTLLEALRLALDGAGPGGVTKDGVDAGDWLEALLADLAAGEKLPALPPPGGFRGSLRPYQGRGVAWLWFLRRFGLGACLADDMGLGKCLAPDSRLAVNGTLRTAEALWESTARQVEYDGEGFWAAPSESLIVNALDEATGRIVTAPIKRLYRQYVRESLRTVVLEDGSRVTITRRHQLLTHKGWTNELRVGDYVGQHLQRLLAQEVFYCRVKAIEDVDYEGWVYDFQVENHHNFVANSILCHNTVQTAALLLHVREQGAVSGPALVICPTSVVGNWQREMGRFAPELKVLLHHGSDRLTDEAFVQAAGAHDLVVSSFGLLRRDADTLGKIHWSAVIVDEAQNIKNPETRQAQVARKLPADYRIALTGTPVENRLSDLWSIMQFLNPGYLGSQRAFRQEFVVPVERYGDADAAARLRRLVQPFMLRRLKTDPTIISDLPEKNEMKVYCPLTPEQATLYEAVVKDTLEKVESSEGIERRGLVLAMLMKLKQVCNHPAHFLGDGSALAGRSGKLARLAEMLEEVQSIGDRALVFTQFYEMGEMLRKYLGETLGGGVQFLHGGTPQKQRERMVARFQEEDDAPGIFILSLKAGGTGLNLTRANHVFHFDRWWNPAVENQATDRAFRIGQRRDVQVHKFVCLGTLEERIDDLIESKRALAENVLGAGEAWLTELSTDQLRDLLALRRDAVTE